VPSALQQASDAAFTAGDNAAAWAPAGKHLPSAGGTYAKWAAGASHQDAVERALKSDAAQFSPDATLADRIVVRTDLGSVVGSTGQTSVKAVIGSTGKLITAYPVR
jgi:hypothetical protein